MISEVDDLSLSCLFRSYEMHNLHKECLLHRQMLPFTLYWIIIPALNHIDNINLYIIIIIIIIIIKFFLPYTFLDKHRVY